MSGLTRQRLFGVSGTFTIIESPGTNLFNSFTPGAGTLGANGGGGNNGNRRALARRAQLNKGVIVKDTNSIINRFSVDGRKGKCKMPTLWASRQIYPPTNENFINFEKYIHSKCK